MNKKMLEVNNLSVDFETKEGIVHAVKDVSFNVNKGEAIGIVGESGSGKTVTALSIMGLVPNPPGYIKNGQIIFNEEDLLKTSSKQIEKIRGNDISMIFQDPMTSLNPIHKCGKQIMESLILHKNISKKDARDKAVKLLKMVGIPLPEKRIDEYPHQLSGGMRQRVMIAMALACDPALLIADEPTTALDVTIEAQIINLLKKLRKEIKMGTMLITHNMGLVARMCDRVIIMYTGNIVESGSVNEILKNPKHPYTYGLLKSIPEISDKKRSLYTIKGSVPNPYNMPEGCSFYPRCPEVKDICKSKDPKVSYISGRKVKCWKFV